MKSLLLCLLATAVSVVGVLVEVPWLTGATSLIAIVYAFILGRDVAYLHRVLASILAGIESRGVTQTLLSSFGTLVHDQLEAVRYRLQTLSWELGTLARGVLPTGDGKKNDLRDLITSPEECCSQFAERVKSEFRASALAIGTKERILFQHGVSGSRFDQTFHSFFLPAFREGNQQCLGLHDSFAERRALGGFGEFGLRWSLSAGFQARVGDCVVWLGYPPERSPTETELLRFPVLVDELAGQVRVAEERKEFSSRVSEAERRTQQNSKLIAEISHDVRSPLSNIKAVLGVLKLEGVGADTPQLLTVAESNCVAMNEILESLIDFSRVQTGSLAPRREMVSLNEVVEVVGQSFMISAKAKGLELRIVLPPQRVEVRFDRLHLRRILSNLISNAIKYTERGAIMVQLDVRDERGLVRVTDTGRGLTQDQLSRLFTPFSRFHSEMAEGIGLGLALTRSLAEANGAEVRVTSAAGKGSEFELAFKEPAHIFAQAETHESREVGFPPKRRAVLVVDDNRDAVDTLARTLELRGLTVRRAYGATEAVTALSGDASEIGVVISDVHMPRGGIEALLAHRALMRNPPAVIALSGSSHSAQRLLRAGVFEVVLKPADLDDLVKCVARAEGSLPVEVEAAA